MDLARLNRVGRHLPVGGPVMRLILYVFHVFAPPGLSTLARVDDLLKYEYYYASFVAFIDVIYQLYVLSPRPPFFPLCFTAFFMHTHP
jgi:hypothetical protein